MEPIYAAICTAITLSPVFFGAAWLHSKEIKKIALFRSQIKEILSGERQPTVNELNEHIDKYLGYKTNGMFGWKEEDNMNLDSLRHLRDKLLPYK